MLKVAGCQVPDIRSDLERALAVVRERTLEAQASGARLVTFPECFLQGYETSASHVEQCAIELSGAGFSAVTQALGDLDAVVVLGLIERDARACYNSAVVLKGGQLLARYRKQHLTDSERLVFQPGSEMPVVDVDGCKVAVNICYDLQFTDAALAAARAGARVLACPCNNMLPREAADAWKRRHNELRSLRAREANLWLVSSDVTGERDDRISFGPTAVIDTDGVVRAQVPLLTEGLALWQVDQPASVSS